MPTSRNARDTQEAEAPRSPRSPALFLSAPMLTNWAVQTQSACDRLTICSDGFGICSIWPDNTLIIDIINDKQTHYYGCNMYIVYH